MGRPVSTAWYETYQQGLTLEQAHGTQRLSDPELAALLGLKPKTWLRMRIAGRLLDGLTPPFDRDRLQCGYAPLERLAKLWSSTPETAQAVLDAVLSNQMKLPELEEVIRGQAPAKSEHKSSRPARASSAKTVLFSQLEAFFDACQLHPFNAYQGRILRRRSTLGVPGGYYLYDAQGQLQCLVLCIQPGAWRDPATAARELYEHALSQRHLAPHIWYVFERANAVLQRLAELSLYWGGSPYDANGHWLFLAHFDDHGVLQVLFEDHFAHLIQQIQAGAGLVEETELYCALEALDGQAAPKRLPLRPMLELPEPNKRRPYREIVDARIQMVGKAEGASRIEQRQALENELGL